MAAAGVLGLFAHLLDPESSFEVEKALSESFPDSPLGLFVLLVLVAPAVETVIFQWGLLMLVKKATRWTAKSDSWTPAFLVSSLVFAAAHALGLGGAWLGFLRVLPILPLSFALSLLAVVERGREGGGRPVAAVCALHALNNLFVSAMIAFFPAE